MSNQIRPSSELFINNASMAHSKPNTNAMYSHTQHVKAQSSSTVTAYHPLDSPKNAQQNLQAHPTVLKPRHRYPRLSRIPVKSARDDRRPIIDAGNQVNPTVLDTILQAEDQTISTIRKINDLYSTASFVMPPYLAKQLAELKVMDEEAWMTKFPQDIDSDSKVGAVQSLLIELGLVVARLSEMVKKERSQNDVD